MEYKNKNKADALSEVRDFWIKDRVAVIMRGISGSGKSTFANSVKRSAPDCAIHSTDSLRMKDGVYVFVPQDTGYLHSKNLRNFIASLDEKTDVVVCDNTNTEPLEFGVYAKTAEAFGYKAVVVTIITNNTEGCFQRNLHQVPKRTIVRQYNKLNANNERIPKCWNPIFIKE